MTIRVRRSVLYMPAINKRALDKARSIPADALIIDLEDSVAPDVKREARETMQTALADGGYGERERVVRINGLDTPWGDDDLAAAIEAGADGILVPKVSAAEDLFPVHAVLSSKGSPAKIWAMMETPRAMIAAPSIAIEGASRAPSLAVFVLGTNDLAKDTRTALLPGRAAYLPWLMHCLAAARSAGLDIIDGVFNDLDDAEGFAAECRQGRDLGMDGKTLIHPKQVATCNTIFAPSADEIAWAREVCAAFDRPENSRLGVIRLNGQMVERLHRHAAERILALSANGET